MTICEPVKQKPGSADKRLYPTLKDRRERAEQRSQTDEIYAWVRRVPEGNVATYGQVAALAGRRSARQVGYAMAALQGGSEVPWHRVINSRGKISPRAGSEGHLLQRVLLEAEGIVFSADDKVDLEKYGWMIPAGDSVFS